MIARDFLNLSIDAFDQRKSRIAKSLRKVHTFLESTRLPQETRASLETRLERLVSTSAAGPDKARKHLLKLWAA